MKTALLVSIAVIVLAGCGESDDASVRVTPVRETQSAPVPEPEPEPEQERIVFAPEPPKEPETEKVDVYSLECFGNGARIWKGTATDVSVNGTAQTTFVDSTTNRKVEIYGENTCVMEVVGTKTRQVAE